VPAFQESAPPSWANPGATISGEIYVGIDPFFYLERLKDEPGMPNLFRDWIVRRILLETTPWVESKDSKGRRLLTRAELDPSFVDVRQTDAWNDDHGHGHYVLECELQDAVQQAPGTNVAPRAPRFG
jgi:hypothetical protein